MKTSIQFRSEGQIVRGNLYLASEPSKTVPTILLLSGFPGNEADVLGLGETLSQYGFNILTFNYRGIYQSEGDYSLQNTQVDIGAAFNFLQNEETIGRYHIDSSKLVLGGWSYGGGMGLIYAANHPEVKHIFSIAGTDHGEFAREYLRNKAFANTIDEIFEGLKLPNGPVNFSGKRALKEELILNPGPYDLLRNMPKLVDRNILLIGAWDDVNVVIEHHIMPGYRTLQKLGAKHVSIQAFQDNHEFENCRLELASSIVAWVDTLFSKP